MTATAEQTTDDELSLVLGEGHKLTFIVASLTKRMLQVHGLKPAERLDLLERLNRLTDTWFTADMLAMLEPMCDTGYAIFNEARSLDTKPDERCSASFNLLATPKVFRHFMRLNPSIAAVVKQREPGRYESTPPVARQEQAPAAQYSQQQAVMGAAEFALTQRRANGSHYGPDKIARMGGTLPDWVYDSEKDNA